MCAVLLERSLLSHMHKMDVHMSYFSVNAQTRLSMHAVLPEHSLLSHMHKMGVHLVYHSIQCSDAHEHVCSLARAFTALTQACTKWAYIGHILSVNARQSLCGSHIDTFECRQRIRSKSVHVYKSNFYIYNKYQNAVRWLKYNTCLMVCCRLNR